MNTKHLQIKKGSYLVEQEVQTGSTKSIADNLSHIWIIDRSGSMQYLLHSLIQDLISKSKELKGGDVLSVGWFSSPGEYRFVLKGFKISGAKDYAVIEKTLLDLAHVIGTTCFSEILVDTNTVISELTNFGLDFALMFLTDGYPVVPNYAKEIKEMMQAIDALEGQITSTLLVGYGNYYNKELMSEMTEHFGGSLIHSGALADFSLSMNEFIVDARENGSKISVAIPEEARFPFSINSKSVNVYTNKDGTVSYTPSKNQTNYIYYLSDKKEGEEVVMPALAEDKYDQEETRLLRASYALAYILCNKTKTQEALEVLATIGDVAHIKGVTNAFTNEEYGNVESKIKKAITSTKERFSEGRNMKYLPDENAFCLIDLADTLLSDSGIKFYPYHKEFSYNRIGVASEQKADFPKFKAVENPFSLLNGLVWNKSRLNLSIRAKIDGTVTLPDEAKRFGFSTEYPTFIWRNYTIVKDGFLNINSLILSDIADHTKKILHEKNNLLLETLGDGFFKLNLALLPVMNRAMSKNKTSAKALCERVWEERQLEAQIKAVKFFKEEIEEKLTEKSETLSKDAEEFLKKYGISAGGYSPKVETKEPTDFYMAKEFDIKISKYSSLPKVEDVLEKVKGKKVLTPSEELLNTGILLYRSKVKESDSDRVKIIVAGETLESLNKKLREVRSDIQRTKFGFILGKQSFDEFSSREENTIAFDNRTYTVSLREVRVPV